MLHCDLEKTFLISQEGTQFTLDTEHFFVVDHSAANFLLSIKHINHMCTCSKQKATQDTPKPVPSTAKAPNSDAKGSDLALLTREPLPTVKPNKATFSRQIMQCTSSFLLPGKIPVGIWSGLQGGLGLPVVVNTPGMQTVQNFLHWLLKSIQM